MRTARAFGVSSIMLANALVAPAALAFVAAELADADFSFASWVDSIATVEAMERGLAASGASLPRPIDVLVELGAPGGRTGARTLDEAEALARRVADSPALRLAGVAGYEGSLGHDRSPTAMVAVRDYLSDLLELHEAVRRIAPDDELIVSAGGSAYLDVVADVFDFEIEAEAEGARTRWVLRSGASLLHDDGFYHGISPLDGGRATAGTAALAPAMRGYARVVSHPEPRLALLDGGKRDFPYDEGLPVPFGVASALGGDEAPLAGASVTALNDQHAFLRSDAPLPVVDRRRRVARALAPVHRLRQAALAPRRRARRQHARRRPRAHVLLRHGHRMTLLIRDVIAVDADGTGHGPTATAPVASVDVVLEGEHIVRVEPRGTTAARRGRHA